MNIKKRILIPMIALTSGCGIAVLLITAFLYSRDVNDAVSIRVNTAQNVVTYEIEEIIQRTNLTATAVARNHELIDALRNYDGSNSNRIENGSRQIIYTANSLKDATQVDFCIIIDRDGLVIARTHDPGNFGDSSMHLPNVAAAFMGMTRANLSYGINPAIRLGVTASAPIYDENMDIIGIITVGYRLDDQEFVYKLKNLTECEITIFLGDERIATTVKNRDGTYGIGTNADAHISGIVLSGEIYSERANLFEKGVYTVYSPLHDVNENVIGMTMIAFYTEEATSRLIFSVVAGILITLAVLVVCFVITKIISRKIIRQLEYTHLLFHATPLACTLWDKNRSVIDCNNTVVKVFGLGSKQEFKERIGELLPPYQPCGTPTIELMNLHIEKARKDGQSVLEFWHVLPDGEPLPVEVTVVRANDEIGAYVATYVRDLREEKAHLAEIRLQNSLLNTFFDSVPDIVFVKDMNLCFTHINKAFMEHFNCDENAIGKNDADGLGIPQELASRFNEVDRKIIDSREVNIEEEYVPGADGRVPFFETIKVPLVLDGEPIGILGIARDITKRKEMMEAAQEASRSKSAFLANMSHEIRTPMNSIIGFSELALDGENPPKTKDYLTKIAQNSEWLLQIINDILDISKIESGKFELENIPFDLCELFKSCRTLIMPKAEEKGLKMHFYAEPSVGKKICGDPTRLRQVLINLLSNAVKFTNSGMVKMLAVITHATADKATMLFEVKDSGIGMTAEQIKTICDPFMQADSSVTRKFGGTGLGLAISRNFVELMGGKIQVESMPGLGSKFSFELTFDLIDDDKAVLMPKQTVFNEAEKPRFSGEVLVCEDNTLNQQVIREHLSRVGLSVVVAGNGKEGIDFIQKRLDAGEKPFDLIFMDMHMPVMDGLESVDRILKMGVSTPIVALTANIMSDALELYQTSGIADTVGKPFTAKELWRCLIKYFKNENTSLFADSAAGNSSKENDDGINIEEMQRIFVKDHQETYAKFIDSLEADDIKTAYRLIHSLKSNAGFIKENRLKEAAAALETLLARESNPTDSIQEHLDVVKAELEEILEKLAYLLPEQDSRSEEKLNSGDRERILALFVKLKPLLINKRTDSLNYVNELRAVPGLEKLAELTEQCKFKQALGVLEGIKGELGNGR